MKIRFGLNAIILLGFALLTVAVWISASLYHAKNDTNIPPKLRSEAENPLPDSFDSATLKKLYTAKDTFNGTDTTQIQ